ncbi:MAG: hypothetical protein ACFCU7_05245 [Pleurocapsa sp.]
MQKEDSRYELRASQKSEVRSQKSEVSPKAIVLNVKLDLSFAGDR